MLVLEQSHEELLAMATITRVLGIPSDYTFAAEHWRPLTREQALELNPFYTLRLPADAHLYSCDQLGPDNLCRAHDRRPSVCRGYPWYDQAPRAMPLADPECGYEVDKPTPPPPASPAASEVT